MNSNIGQTNVIMTSNGWSPRSTSIYISSERTPLLGNRQDNHRRLTSAETTKVNVSVLLLGLILIGGASAGIYLLSQQSEKYNIFFLMSNNIVFSLVDKEYMIHFPFDLIERKFWGASDFPGGPLLNHSFVTTIALFHTRGPMCYSMKTCSLVLREMQVWILF